jgi:hypothetical protein
MRSWLRILACFFASSALFTISAHQTPATNSQGLTFAQQALIALRGSTVVSDVTLSGTGTRSIGPDSESGNFTVIGLGSSQSRFDLNLRAGTRTELFNLSSTGMPQGFWSANGSVMHAVAGHNSLVGQIWFFPELSIVGESSNPAVVVSYLGRTEKNAQQVEHLRFALSAPSVSNADAGILARLTATDVYLDASTSLPVALAFDTHPDKNSTVDLRVEVDYSDYRTVEGVEVPFHIQKFLNGSLFLDLNVQHAAVNSGLTASSFAAN